LWADIASCGVNLDAIAAQLEREGVSSFQKSFDELIAALTTKAAALRGDR
jgi:transaldolase